MIKNKKSEKKIKKQGIETIKELRKTIVEQKQIIEDYSLSRHMLIHELRNPLNLIIGFSSLLKDGNSELKERKDYFSKIEKAGEYMDGLLDVIQIGEITKEEIQKNSRIISLESIAKESADIQSDFLEKEKIKLSLFYNKQAKSDPITLYTNEGIIKVIWNTLVGNALNYSLQESQIKQAIKINKKDNLEILMENTHNGRILRKVAGMNLGIGTMYTSKILKTIGGTLLNYEKPQIKKEDYCFTEIFGMKELKKQNDGKIWGVKIEIPMKELKPIDY